MAKCYKHRVTKCLLEMPYLLPMVGFWSFPPERRVKGDMPCPFFLKGGDDDNPG